MNNNNNWEAERELECLMQAFEYYIYAKRNLDKKIEDFTGHSPDYYLRHEYDSVSDAAAEVGNYLGKVIDRRVNAIYTRLINSK